MKVFHNKLGHFKDKRCDFFELMEAAPGATAAVRNGGVAMLDSSPFEPSRDEWRVVSEQSVRSSGNEVRICL